MSAVAKTSVRASPSRMDKARQDMTATRDLIAKGEIKAVVESIRERFPKVIERLAR